MARRRREGRAGTGTLLEIGLAVGSTFALVGTPGQADLHGVGVFGA